MASLGRLWCYPPQRQTKVILAAVAIAGLEIDTPPFEFRVSNRSPKFLAKFPLGKIPALENDAGFTLVEGALIARYVCSFAPESGLLGRDIEEQAHIDQWMHFVEYEISMFSLEIQALHSGCLGAHSKQMFEGLVERQARSLRFLDTYLGSCPSGFLVGGRITLADIALAATTQQAGRVTCGAAERALYSNIFNHYEKVVFDPRVKTAFGEADFVEKALAYNEE
ncbi:glutathione S-transferase C-terminal-like protein [Scleroderma citrinum]